MSALEEIRGKTPVLRAGFVPAPPEREWRETVDGLLAGRRAGVPEAEREEPLSGWAGEVDDGSRERLLGALAPLPDLSWLATAHEAHEGAVSAFESAARALSATEARVVGGRLGYAAEVREAIESGSPSPQAPDDYRLGVEVELARGRVASAGIALAAAAKQVMATLHAHRSDLRRLVEAASMCAVPGSADLARAEGHPCVQRAGVLPVRLSVPENELSVVKRFEEAAQELAGFAAASARRHLGGVLSGA